MERKNSWQLSEAAGQVDLSRLQHFLNRSRWDVDELRDRLRPYVTEALACPGGVLVVDETGLVMKGGPFGRGATPVLRHGWTGGEFPARSVTSASSK